MVVLAASICTKGGKAVISRQFRDMTRARIDSLLASFPKVIPTNTQHTSVETSDVRYVYQPLEDLYIVLITNKASNILQDIETLHLFARVVSDMCRASADQREIQKNAFDILEAFDEIVSLGYRESVNLMQVRNILEMESHEEKIQEIIARNKEAEAKEELKRRAKQLEMQRREQQRRAAAGGGPGGSYLGGGISGYAPVPQRYDAPSPARAASPAAPVPKTPAFKKSGMQLGGKKTTQSQLLDALGGEALLSEDMSAPATPVPTEHQTFAAIHSSQSTLPAVTPESVHVVVKESLSLELAREGGLNNLELTGDMNLQITDSALARVKLTLAEPATSFGPELQYKQHPNVGKFAANKERVIALKDPSRSFPVGQSLAVLKWRYAGKDESYVPLSINCWPTPGNDGTCDVNIEYELENEGVVLHDVVISIPLPSGSYPTVSSHSGEWALNGSSHAIDWIVGRVDADESSGTLEFSIGGDDIGAFFPVHVSFVAQGSIAGVRVASIARVDNGEEVTFSEDASVALKNFTVV
ncbi:hypothetical protein BDY19DRAFT_1061213 [Irpex rosettiformis]|uniref:Uncharacterized protein n=1 Tax=Irpex rosettiformis TaxID=378272 RepID=A0ACB8UJ15_9APHY|nr:hypothetical protein BDY19DRAFT_1061213 [Irpex rosettiformis]